MSKRNEYHLAAGMFRMVAGAALGMVLLVPMQVRGQGGFDPADVARLPNYCRHTQTFSIILGTNEAERERWYQRLGPAYHHLHHYCKGLINTMEAARMSNPQQRTNRLAMSISEFDYVLERVPKDFPLLPEILFKKGENLVKLGRGPLALREFQQSIAVKPDYWPPYAASSDLFKALGDTATARQWLEKGLAASPNTKALESRLAELGGAKGKSKPTDKSVEPAQQPKPRAAEISPAPAETTVRQPSSEPKP